MERQGHEGTEGSVVAGGHATHTGTFSGRWLTSACAETHQILGAPSGGRNNMSSADSEGALDVAAQRAHTLDELRLVLDAGKRNRDSAPRACGVAVERCVVWCELTTRRTQLPDGPTFLLVRLVPRALHDLLLVQRQRAVSSSVGPDLDAGHLARHVAAAVHGDE